MLLHYMCPDAAVAEDGLPQSRSSQNLGPRFLAHRAGERTRSRGRSCFPRERARGVARRKDDFAQIFFAKIK